MLGGHSNHQLNPLNCEFENDSGNRQKVKLKIIQIQLNQSHHLNNKFLVEPTMSWVPDSELEKNIFHLSIYYLRKMIPSS